jgi:hypothetical protein
MAVRFRVFASGRLAGGVPAVRADTFYQLFSVPQGKSYIVNAMRFVNTHTFQVPFTIELRHGIYRTTVFPDIQNGPLGKGQCAIEDRELTLGAGEALWAKTETPDKIDFVICGVEREG